MKTPKLFLILMAAVTPAALVPVESHLDLPAHGTPFYFEIVESQDSKYLGDTPAHTGRSGGLTVRPKVALGDSVYAKDKTMVGIVTRVAWNRTAGSLEIEVDPLPLKRIAVGDELWVDLNPETK